MSPTPSPPSSSTALVVLAVVLAASSIAGATATHATLEPTTTTESARTTDQHTAALDVTATATTTVSPGDNQSTAVVARYPAENGSMVERVAFSPADVGFVGAPLNDSRTGLWRIPLRLTDGGADRFAATVDVAGFTGAPGSCPRTDGRNDQGRCLLVLVDGEVQGSFGVSEALLRAVESGAFQSDPRFVLLAENESEALAAWRAFQTDTVVSDGSDAGTADESTTTATTAPTRTIVTTPPTRTIATTTATTAPTRTIATTSASSSAGGVESGIDSESVRSTVTLTVSTPTEEKPTARDGSPTPGFGALAVVGALAAFGLLASIAARTRPRRGDGRH